LKLGFKRLGVPIEITDLWMKRIAPPTNPLGPYIYPIEFVFDKGRQMILYDINTTDMIYHRYLNLGFPYFKIHVRPKDIKRFRIVPVPNTPSTPEFIDHLPQLRAAKDRKVYDYDFFFSGWCSANGLRIKACEIAKKKLGERAYCGLQNFKHHRKAPESLKKGRMPAYTHWMNQAASKLNLALPGGGALPWVSFRHVELWGIGAAVLTYPPDYHLFGNPDPNEIACCFRRDFTTFENAIGFYLGAENTREEIAAAGREYFDKYYMPERQAEIFIEAARNKMK
jgi:hypothetical protein